MEGHSPDVLGILAKESREPVLDFICSLVGKGDGDNAPGGSRSYSAQCVGMLLFVFGGGFAQGFQEFHIRLCNLRRDFLAVAASAIAHKVGNAVNQHGGLAASGSCQQQQRAFGGKHGLLLHII